MNREQIERFEKTKGRMEGLHREITSLAKKSPGDGVNKFKLKLINEAIKECEIVLGAKYKPLEGFDVFDEDDVPTNSDVTLILSLYLEEIERKRADNIYFQYGDWYYRQSPADGGPSIPTAPPRKIEAQ